MEEKSRKYSTFKRWGKRLLWLCLMILVLAAALRLSLKTSFVHSYVRNTIVSAANGQLNAQLSIEKLSGDLWKEVTLSQITLAREDTIAEIDSIHASYNIWALLERKIEVGDLVAHQPRLHVQQEAEGWNFEQFITASSDTAVSESKPFLFRIENFVVNGGFVSVESDSLPLGSRYTISQMNIASGLGYDGHDFQVDLHDFSLNLAEANIDQSLGVQASGSATGENLTLEKLVFATGKSIIEANGYANIADTSVALDVASSPIYWSDVTDVVEEYPIREDVDVTFSLQGKPEQFAVGLTLDADGLESFEMNGRVAWQSELVVKEFATTAKSIDLATLLADTTYPRLQNLDFSFDGDANIADLRQTSGNFTFSASEIKSDPYGLQKLSGKGTLQNQSASLSVEAVEQQQSIKVDYSTRNIWSEVPSVKGNIVAQDINPGYWMQDTTYNGNLTFSLGFEGNHWYPQNKPWSYKLNLREGTMHGHRFTNTRLKGQVSETDITTDGSVNFHDGVIELTASLREFTGVPSYSYQLRTEKFDVSTVLANKGFKTSINGRFSGKGRGFDPADMQLTSSLAIESSVINGEPVENMTADFSIRDSVLTVERAQLQSGIGDGEFRLRLNLLDHYHADNELSLDLQLKDLTALAPLANTDELQASGNVTGTLNPYRKKELRFLGTLDLNSVAYDSLLKVEQVRGSVDVNVGQTFEYRTDLDLQNPEFSGIPLQNLSLKTEGDYGEGIANGRFDFQLSSSVEGRIEQSGTYHVATDSIHVDTDELNLISDYRTLTLEEPFGLWYQNESLRVDTLRISSEEGSFLEMGLPLLSEQEQRGFVRGNALNTTVIQSSLLGKTYFDGMLSGQFNIDRRGTDLKIAGDGVLSEVSLEGVNFDSLLISADIADERLEGNVSVRDQGDELISGDVNLPFKLGNPETFEEAFFEESISGDLRISDVSIDRFQSLFDEAVDIQTSGDLWFWGTLGGTAGDPEFDADVTLRNAVLSGVAIDSITAGANYRHIDEELSLDASVMSLKQSAAEISARFPLFIDMKTFQVDLPQAKDRIAVDIETNDFNLRAINDFLDPLLFRDVRGSLNGNVEVKGAIEDLRTDGYLELTQGRVRLVPAGITVNNIASTVRFKPDQISLASFSAQSGSGNLRANGTIGLDNLVPGKMDLRITARNFRAANTPDYNAVINLESRTQGTLSSPNVTGSLDFLSGFVKLDNFGEKSVENVRLDSEEKETTSIDIYDSLSLDMDVGFNRRFFIRNERYLEMEIELDGVLDLVKKSGSDLELFGDMNAASGYARPFGKRFNIEEGVVTFSGDPENPQLQIRTKYEPPQTQQEVVIWYIIEGTVEDPQFRYESQPPMELENIISYTLFGQPFYALDSWKQVVASSGSNTTAADVALDVLLDRVEALATQQLGIDVVRIDNTHTGGETGTSIMTGWYLNPKVFFAIQNVITGSTPETGFLLEYMLRKNLKLILRQGDNIRQGVDLKWNYDY